MKLKHLIYPVLLISFLGVLQNRVSALPYNSNDSSYQNNEKDPLRDGLGQGINPIDLLHKLTTKPGRGEEDFNNDSQKNIQTAAEKFKKQQLEKIQGNGGNIPTQQTSP